MGDHRTVIDNKIDSLCDYTHCTIRLLNKLTENKIITRYESVEIERLPEGYGRNRALYTAIRRKDGDDFCKLASIMEDEETKQSNTVLSIFKTVTSKRVKTEKTYVLKSKWWPEEKFLVNSFYEGKNNDGLLVEELFKILTEQGNQTAVISPKVTVSGFGGVGKTTMAKWYARHYEEMYEHIIWIDCGEGSLIKSFVQLCTDLKVEQRGEPDLKNLARTCFQTLEAEKCLFIFDNAERYVGCDGIKDVLPRNPNFHSIITSRNREWGSGSGYGQIQQLPLDVFTTDESISFLKADLKLKSAQEKDMKQLCDLLGNHPLALQIATSTLNNHAIVFADYIKIIQRTDQVIGKTFDDYEKTINATLKTSLDFIRQGEDKISGLAYRILLLFGYIRPDNIRANFFEAVEFCESWEIQAAMDLLETYSLVSIDRIMNDNEIIDYAYSIHRLLQQVIRFNGKYSEETTLKKIFECDGHIDIKLLPYTFAAARVKAGFPKLRAELVDQLQLPGLILSRQFDEAFRLSRIIYADLQTSASRFNYAICLKNCQLFDESLSHLRELFSSVSDTRENNLGECVLISLQDEPTKIMVGSEIFIINMLKGDVAEAKKIFRPIQRISMPNTDENLSCIMQAFNAKLCENSGFRLTIMPTYMFFKMCTDNDDGDVIIERCSVDDNILQWSNVRNLKLDYARFTREQRESLGIGKFFPPELTNLVMVMATPYYGIYDEEIHFSNQPICINQLEHLQTLELRNCTITLTDIPLPMRLKSLSLCNVSFSQNGEILHEILLNDFINFGSLKTLMLTLDGIEYNVTGKKPVWLVDMTDQLNLDMVKLRGTSVFCQNWLDANWSIDHLILDHVELKFNRIQIKHLELKRSSVELSDLPSMIQILSLDSRVSFVRTPQDCFLQNLKYLEIIPPFGLRFDILNPLYKCPVVVGLKLDCGMKSRDEFDLSALPTTVRELHLRGVSITGDQARYLDKLVIAGYWTADVSVILTKLRPEHLYCNQTFVNTCNDNRLVNLIQCNMKSIVVGPISWKNFTTCELSSYVDEEGEYYVFQNQRGTRIDRDKFSDFFEFPSVER